MATIFEKSKDTMAQGLESLRHIKQDKEEYRAYLARVAALSADYHFVYDKISDYLWASVAGGDGTDLLAQLSALLVRFEAAVAAGTAVRDVTGADVAAYCDDLLRGIKTQEQLRRDALNRAVAPYCAGQTQDAAEKKQDPQKI